MKRSVAMMACVLSGALMIGSYSPVFAEGAKAVSAKIRRAGNYRRDKNRRIIRRCQSRRYCKRWMSWKMVSTQQSLIPTAPCSM